MDDADFSWVEAALPGFRAVVDEYELEWPSGFAPPAAPEACDAAERALGLRLPPSLRAFYGSHDGGEVAHFRIRSVSELVEHTLRSRVDDPQVYDEPVDDLLDAIDLGDGNRYVLDTSHASADGEYPVLDAFHEYGPSDWRQTVVAPSFGTWLRRVFDNVAARCDAFGEGTPLHESTMSAPYLIASAATLRAEGRVEEARIRLLRAVAYAGSPRALSEDGTIFEQAIERLRELGADHEGDAFLLRLLDHVVDAERRAAGREDGFGISIYCGDSVWPPEDFARRNGLLPPPQLGGIMRAWGSITLFTRQPYPPPLAQFSAQLEIFGGKYFGVRRVDARIHGADPSSQVIAGIGMGTHWAGYPYDLLLADATGRISRVPFRPERGSSWVPRQDTLPFSIEQAGPPVAVAASLDDFIEAAFRRHAAGQAPYDLSIER